MFLSFPHVAYKANLGVGFPGARDLGLHSSALVPLSGLSPGSELVRGPLAHTLRDAPSLASLPNPGRETVWFVTSSKGEENTEAAADRPAGSQ